jgi:hypothetical protein
MPSLDHELVQTGPSSEFFPLYATEEEEHSDEEERAIVEKSEEPGMDSLRGTFGAVGTLVRARRRATALSEVKRKPSNITGRGSEVSTSTRGEPRADSLYASVSSRPRALSDAEAESEKAGQEKLVKLFVTSHGDDVSIARPPPVLRRPNTSPGPLDVLVGGMAETPESMLPLPELRRASSLHAHFDANDIVSRSRSRTLPAVLSPSKPDEEKKL